MSEPETPYDRATCVTALELRELGIPIPECVPDCAWVERSAVQYELKPYDGPGAEPGDQVLRLDWNVKFHKPFKWITMNLVITRNDER